MAGKRWGLEGTPVWVLLYMHQHGTDVWVLQTEKLAIQVAAEVIMDSIDEVGEGDEEVAARVKKLFKDGKYEDVIVAWSDYQQDRMSGESLTWTKARIDSKTSAG